MASCSLVLRQLIGLHANRPSTSKPDRASWAACTSLAGLSSDAPSSIAKRRRAWNRHVKATTIRRSDRAHGNLCICASGMERDSEGRAPFPFDKGDYIEVAIQLIKPQRTVGEATQATLVLYSRAGAFLDLFKKQVDKSELSKLKHEKCLVVEIGGDTVLNISAAMEAAQFSRPLALDLLWKVLRRGQEVSKVTWGIVRVAIVDLRDGTFIGRVFFGDAETGEIFWDCDCRPSDGMWLALQSQCPVYVRKLVWETASVPLAKLMVVSSSDEDELIAKPPAPQPPGEAAEAGEPRWPGLGLKATDPEPIKRLKRELGVAVGEEDYEAATRIRDHPFMKLYAEIQDLLKRGEGRQAKLLQAQLDKAIREGTDEADGK